MRLISTDCVSASSAATLTVGGRSAAFDCRLLYFFCRTWSNTGARLVFYGSLLRGKRAPSFPVEREAGRAEQTRGILGNFQLGTPNGIPKVRQTRAAIQKVFPLMRDELKSEIRNHVLNYGSRSRSEEDRRVGTSGPVWSVLIHRATPFSTSTLPARRS